MNKPAIKERQKRARAKAMKILQGAQYGVITTGNDPFTFIAVRDCEARFIRIVLDRATASDLSAVKNFSVPSNCKREIWASTYREADFQTRNI